MDTERAFQELKSEYVEINTIEWPIPPAGCSI